MLRYTKTTKSCFSYENMKNKKLNLNSAINKTAIGNINKTNTSETNAKVNKININKAFQIKKESTTVVNKSKWMQNTSLQKTLNNNSNNNDSKKKINDYFNTLIREDTISTNNLCQNNKDENTKGLDKVNLKLEIPESLKKLNTILPPVNYKKQKIHLKPLKTEQLHIASTNDGKMVLKKKSFSNSQLKNCLLVIYDDIMIDDYETNQVSNDKTNNDSTTVKTNKKLNRDFYNLINEIKICYNTNEVIDSSISDHKNVEDKCHIKKLNQNNKSYNKILDDIYSLNINDENYNKTNDMVIEMNKKIISHHNSTISNERNKLSKKVIVQKTLLSTLKSPVIHKARKRKFSNNAKLNVKQTKLNFLPKKQKTI